jgi:hypothetical protein
MGAAVRTERMGSATCLPRGHRVNAAGMKGMAAGYAAQRQPATAYGAVHL